MTTFWRDKDGRYCLEHVHERFRRRESSFEPLERWPEWELAAKRALGDAPPAPPPASFPAYEPGPEGWWLAIRPDGERHLTGYRKEDFATAAEIAEHYAERKRKAEAREAQSVRMMRLVRNPALSLRRTPTKPTPDKG